ncbi:hypothetical protein [Streptomyces chartreusis]|uniref:hypothetical protein n=1 Tax=Streptomyces chartreusis TaxID=1969 RepID=UPI00167271A1|nr:hypothetical protein [Streptomyces chartreusis]GGX56463.1 hypothetical protein GCM10010321_87210 [Streptomyces chartreusis]
MAEDVALDGFLDEEIVSGHHGASARFRIIVSPTDERADEMLMPCTVNDPAMAAAALHDLQPGDQLRVTGTLQLPRTPDTPMWLEVTTLDLLHPAPPRNEPAMTAVLERLGPYICYLDADTDEVPAWTETGAWVGVADTPADLEDLFDTYEQARRASGD